MDSINLEIKKSKSYIKILNLMIIYLIKKIKLIVKINTKNRIMKNYKAKSKKCKS